MDKCFVIMIDDFYYGGESDTPSQERKSHSDSWYAPPTEISQIKLVQSLEEAKVMDGYTNLNSHWKRIYDALRYGELKANNISFRNITQPH